jgi:RHS repeat-associated protein
VSVGGKRSGVTGCGNALASKKTTTIKLSSLHIFKPSLTPEEVMTLYTNEGIQPPPPAPNPQELLAAKRGGYRYGFNSMERDDELKGAGNSYDFGARIYDSRLGRFLSLDPLQKNYPSLSAYSFVANSPIMLVEVDGRWFVKFDNPADPKQLVFVAEDGDDLSTLEIHLGVKPGTLTNHSSLNGMPIKTGTELSTQLEILETVKAINGYLQSDNISSTNCANCTLSSNGISSTPMSEDGGFSSVSQATEFVKNGTNVSESQTQIGDLITYKYSLEGATGFLLSNGIQDVYKNPDGSIKMPSELEPQINEWYKNQSDLQHFSVILLKDRSGQSIQQILEKPGETPVQISSGTGDGSTFEPSGVESGSTPYYSPK